MKDIKYTSSADDIIGYRDSKIAQNENNDCWVRALASAFEKPYDEAHEYVAKAFNRRPKHGTQNVITKMRALNNTLFGVEVTELESKELSTYYSLYGQVVTRMMTVGTFIKTYPTGTYILLVRGHAFTIKNGVVVGNSSDATKLKVRVMVAWKVK